MAENPALCGPRTLRRKVIATLGAATILTSIWVVPARAAYTTPCWTTTNNFHAFLDKPMSSSTHVTYMHGQVDYVRYAWACGLWGASYVLPVNIQGNDILVQFGYGERAIDEDDYYLYTPHEGNRSNYEAGTLEIAEIGMPILGHRVVFYTAYRSDVDRWKFTLVNDTLDDSWSFYTDDAAQKHWGTWPWAGFEVWNNGDQLGGAGSNTYISNIAYLATGGSETFFGAGQSTWNPQGQQRTYWYVSSDTLNGRARIRAHTDDH